MKIITININKGGAGKTTVAHNFAEFLAREKKVLLFDFDDSANLTHRYGEFENTDNTVVGLFQKGKASPIKVKENLDLIAGHQTVELLKEWLNTQRRREYVFGKWLAENFEWLDRTYDFIVIDTENDEGIMTVNAMIVSDVVLGLAEAAKDSVEAISRLREFTLALNKDFDVRTAFYFIGNKINLSENASKSLLEAMAAFPEYLGYLPRRTFLATDEALVSQESIKNKEDVEQILHLFHTLQVKLEEANRD